MLGGQLFSSVGEQAFKVDDLRFVFLQRLFGFGEACNLWCYVVLALSQIKFNHSKTLLDGDQFIIPLPQFVPSDQNLLNELFNWIALEHPFKRRLFVI